MLVPFFSINLDAWGQAADEIPMLLLAIFILATLLGCPQPIKVFAALDAATPPHAASVVVYTTFPNL